MTGEQQQIVIFEPGFWSTVDRIITDLLTQQIPASVVLLIIFCLIMPFILRFVWRWWFGSNRRN